MNENVRPRQREKKMLPAIRQLITVRALNDPNKDRTELAEELIIEVKNKYPKEIPPSVSTLIKKISEDRSSKNESFLDKPWHLGLLINKGDLNPPLISAEAIEAILKVQKYINHDIYSQILNNHNSLMTFASKDPTFPQSRFRKPEIPFLSIRQSKWIPLLHRVIGNKINRLYYTSLVYSTYEKICEISNTPFDTSELDFNLLNWIELKKILSSYITSFTVDVNYRNLIKYFSYEEIEK
jgi:hypothetical protein